MNNLSRRGFFGVVGGAVVAAKAPLPAVDPVRDFQSAIAAAAGIPMDRIFGNPDTLNHWYQQAVYDTWVQALDYASYTGLLLGNSLNDGI